MPGVKKTGGGQWGISWREVGELIVELEQSYSCRLESAVLYLPYGKSNLERRWCVATRAITGRAGASRIEGYAECSVGAARGASSFPGAFVRSIHDACADLEKRKADKRYQRDNPVPERT